MLTMIKEFIILGAVTFGGGLAMIPIFLDIVSRNNWMSEQQFMQLISISQATPGPLAINMATFVGFLQYGLFGTLVASSVLLIPGFLIATLMGSFVKKHKDSHRIKNMMLFLRCAILGLLLSAVVFLILRTFWVGGSFSFKALIILAIAVILNRLKRINIGLQVLMFGVLGALLL